MKEVKLFNDKISRTITDIPQLKFLDFEEEGVEVQANTLEINGTDGVLLGPTSFGPFNLVLNFSFKGEDKKRFKVIKTTIKNIIF